MNPVQDTLWGNQRVEMLHHSILTSPAATTNPSPQKPIYTQGSLSKPSYTGGDFQFNLLLQIQFTSREFAFQSIYLTKNSSTECKQASNFTAEEPYRRVGGHSQCFCIQSVSPSVWFHLHLPSFWSRPLTDNWVNAI